MVKPIVRILSGVAGSAFMFLSLLGIAVSLLAIIDPAGAKAADDNDPLGVPPSFVSSLGVLGLYLAIGALGAYLLWLCCRRRTPTI